MHDFSKLQLGVANLEFNEGLPGPRAPVPQFFFFFATHDPSPHGTQWKVAENVVVKVDIDTYL